ncbi:fasciclin domain-containing protein [Hymenobacter wooponensis]|uniref:Fasciclin domain-containing protein n=1 Tax=Hymenobacter wooponensis TaxID=1525360 RepID=A0A4Z0MQ20_9BACT|nr:fasciclin domain-containing protein [Hymenobacter wooponensis]TGD81741.1 fasciclin domain-containing protein [Hymenobacter wooponensis]
MKHLFSFLLAGLVVSATSLTSCQREDVAPSIANIAVAGQDFSVLEDAAIRGGVAITLTNKATSGAQYTVFAPTNAAFARLGLNSASDLLALQKPFLTSTLLYHTAAGRLESSTFKAGSTSASLAGPTRRIITRDGNLYVNGSRILALDVQAANGMVHPIDKVLLATGADIVQSALALKNGQVFVKPELTFLVEALIYCNLTDALTAKPGSPSFTVFAPTDAAFKDLGRKLGVALDQPADIRKLPQATVTAVLLNHVANNGGTFTPELKDNANLTTLGGEVKLGLFTDGVVPVQGKGNTTPATMVIPDVQCTNGVVHVIDQVLLP